MICVDHFWVIVAPTVSYAAPWSSKPRQREGFSLLLFVYCSHRHTVFSSPLAINISRLFEKEVLPGAYLCVDLWGIRNCRADLFGRLFKGKGEFMFPPPAYLFCATHSAAQTNSAYSSCQERLVPQSWNQGRLYFKPFSPSPHYPSASIFFSFLIF